MKTIFYTIILVLFSCTSSKKNQSKSQLLPKDSLYNPLTLNQIFDREGHRGCRGLMPENTIPAMLHALELGVTTLEMDISFSKDKKALLSHEPFFNHEITTKPDGSFIEEKEERNYNLYTMNYDSIVKYDVGLKSHPRFAQQQKIKAVKPLLADLFKTVKQYMITAKRPFPFFNIETKTLPATDNIYHPAPAEFVDLLMKIITDEQMESYVIIQSFDYRTLKYLHKNYPKIKTALLIDEGEQIPVPLYRDLEFFPDILSPHFSFVNAQMIAQLHFHNIKVIPWTVNDKLKITQLKALGVDGIISDYPNLFNQ